MLNPKLQERLKGFLPLVRVGIDFGEGAGGSGLGVGVRRLRNLNSVSWNHV